MAFKYLNKIFPSPLFKYVHRAKKLFKNSLSLARDYGQWKTIRDWKSVDHLDRPIPWYTYPATEYLNHLDLSHFSAFEYGSGNSTVWWSTRVKSLLTVEDNPEWHLKLVNQLKSSKVQHLLKTIKSDYVSIAPADADILIIDGSHRRECAEYLTQNNSNSLMIIFDNADWHPMTIKYLQKNLEWIQVDFHGFGPINDYTWTTSIFINPARHKEITYKEALKSKSGLTQVAKGDY